MRVVMIVLLLVHVTFTYSQQTNLYENDNFKLEPAKAKSKATEIIFKAGPTVRVLKTKDINPFLKIGLPFKEGYSEESNTCWMIYDSSLHHIEMIDTLLNHGIAHASVSTSTFVNIFEKHIIASYSIRVNLDEWNKTLMYGGKIYDVNGSQIFEAVGLPEKVLNLGLAQIDSSGKYLATIRSEHFEESEGGHLNPLDFFMDIFSIPEFKLLKTEKVSSSNLNYNNGRIWHITSYYDRVTNKHSEEVFFLDFDKNKKYTIHPEGSFGFSQSIEKSWLSDGILLQGNDGTFIKKTFDRDFIVEDIFKK